LGEKTPAEFEAMKEKVDKAYHEAIEKRRKILEYLKARIISNHV
jgi:hydrogenase maturation factor HypE